MKKSCMILMALVLCLVMVAVLCSVWVSWDIGMRMMASDLRIGESLPSFMYA